MPPQRTQADFASPFVQVSEGLCQGHKEPHETQKLHSSVKANIRRSDRKRIGGSSDIPQSDERCDGRHW